MPLKVIVQRLYKDPALLIYDEKDGVQGGLYIWISCFLHGSSVGAGKVSRASLDIIKNAVHTVETIDGL